MANPISIEIVDTKTLVDFARAEFGDARWMVVDWKR